MKSLILYIAAAGAEIAGCFAFWAWLKLGKSGLWLIPGVALAGVGVGGRRRPARPLGRHRRGDLPDRRRRHSIRAPGRLGSSVGAYLTVSMITTGRVTAAAMVLAVMMPAIKGPSPPNWRAIT